MPPFEGFKWPFTFIRMALRRKPRLSFSRSATGPARVIWGEAGVQELPQNKAVGAAE
jgi:hypothetical protein